MAPGTINGWESPKFITQYNKTIDKTELEIRTYESQRKFEGRIEDNRNPNNWLEIFYDHDLDKWRYMVPGKLPNASIKRGRIIAQKIKTAEDLAELMVELAEEIKDKCWSDVISDIS